MWTAFTNRVRKAFTEAADQYDILTSLHKEIGRELVKKIVPYNQAMPVFDREVEVCIAGAGPAGMVVGLLLARQGIRVLVLERHENFDREYRGEVLMPRFVQMMRQIGLFDFLLKYPHLTLDGFELYIRRRLAATIRVSELAREAPFILWMPQTVMLNALHEKSKEFPNFELWFNAAAEEPLLQGNRTIGLAALVNGKRIRVGAKVSVGADGRASVLRRRGEFALVYEKHDFDIIWFTIPKPDGYDNTVRAFLSANHNYLILPKYPNHVQCGLLIETGGYARYLHEGIGSLKKELLEAHPMFRSFAEELTDFKPFNVLAARADRVKEWAKDGLILVGDAAHTCSPVGAVGVSVAVATAIVAADVIGNCLRTGECSKEALGRVQTLREEEVVEIQRIQERFSGLILTQNPFLKRLSAVLLLFGVKAGLFRRIMRRLIVMRRPLPVR